MHPTKDIEDGGGRPNPAATSDRYQARFEGGPWRGSVRELPAHPEGGPLDFLPVLVEDEGVYALAGGEDAEGQLPYWWISLDRAAMLQNTFVRIEPWPPFAAVGSQAES